ncbi:MAG: DUF2157 domain-containing protein [Gammaproteobacteria bacterium]|nr:DUF2157 domain-containing protein [Gammaproteobacteria bacterium]
MRRILQEQLLAEINDWHRGGIIDSSTHERLVARYAPRDWLGAGLKWLGMFAVVLLGAGVLSAIALAMSDSPMAWAVMLGAAGAVAWHAGARMAADVRQRHAITGSILVTVGLLAGYGCLSLVYVASGGDRYDDAIPGLMLITAAGAVATAYRFVLRWPLFLGLLLLFHGVGIWHAYVGHGGYFAHIQDERVMAVVALLSIALGYWHESRLEAGTLRRHQGFGSLYLIFGLLYFNLSLWFLTIPRPTLAWVAVFTAAAVCQIVAGARFKDARFTGFGIVFLSIDMYTRYYEHFWDRISAGMFFLLAGAVAVAAGTVLEWQALRALRQKLQS